MTIGVYKYTKNWFLIVVGVCPLFLFDCMRYFLFAYANIRNDLSYNSKKLDTDCLLTMLNPRRIIVLCLWILLTGHINVKHHVNVMICSTFYSRLIFFHVCFDQFENLPLIFFRRCCLWQWTMRLIKPTHAPALYHFVWIRLCKTT